MKRYLSLTLLTGAALLFAASGVFAQQGFDQEPETEKLAQTGMKFLSVSLDARSASMGDAISASNNASATGMFYNPASMARMNSTFEAVVGQAQWIVDIDYNYAALSFKPGDGGLGVFGFSLLTVDYGDITETIRFDNEAGYLDVGEYSPTALAVGFGYANALTDRFAVGGNVKYVREDLGASILRGSTGSFERSENKASTMAFDFGLIYQTGYKSLTFGMNARNFSQELTYAEESFELPLTFRIGLSMDMLDFSSMDQERHALLLSVDTERPRDFSDMVRLGVEYKFLNRLSLRGGYAFPQDESGVSFGGGFYQSFGENGGVQIDYSYTDFGVFDKVNRFTFKFAF